MTGHLSTDAHDRVRDYFTENYLLFKYLWAGSYDLAFHMGFWDENTKSKSEALINENRDVAERLNLNAGDEVLDIGCGFGGTAIWMAENYKARVTGIDFVAKNIDTAKKMARRRGVQDLTEFTLRDFEDIQSADNSFDRAYAIESYAYARDGREFLADCFRLLRLKGVLVIADYFRSPEVCADDAEALEKWQATWAYTALPGAAKTMAWAEDCGFRVIGLSDKTAQIAPSSVITQRLSRFAYVIKYVLHRLGLHAQMPDARAVEDEVRLFTDHIITYAVVTLVKE